MAKEILTRVWCDLCLGEDEEREEATHMNNAVTLGLGAKARPQSLDLCDRHYKELLEPLVEALSAYGAPVGEAPRALKLDKQAPERPLKCGVPGCTTGPLASIGSFGSHIRQMHGITVKDYRAQYGPPVAVGSEPAPAADLFAAEAEAPGPIGESEAICPECDKVYSHELGNNRPAQALSVHLAKTHGIAGKTKQK